MYVLLVRLVLVAVPVESRLAHVAMAPSSLPLSPALCLSRQSYTSFLFGNGPVQYH